jgi:hypothetical protein
MLQAWLSIPGVLLASILTNQTVTSLLVFALSPTPSRHITFLLHCPAIRGVPLCGSELNDLATALEAKVIPAKVPAPNCPIVFIEH